MPYGFHEGTRIQMRNLGRSQLEKLAGDMLYLVDESRQEEMVGLVAQMLAQSKPFDYWGEKPGDGPNLEHIHKAGLRLISFGEPSPTSYNNWSFTLDSVTDGDLAQWIPYRQITGENGGQLTIPAATVTIPRRPILFGRNKQLTPLVTTDYEGTNIFTRIHFDKSRGAWCHPTLSVILGGSTKAEYIIPNNSCVTISKGSNQTTLLIRTEAMLERNNEGPISAEPFELKEPVIRLFTKTPKPSEAEEIYEGIL